MAERDRNGREAKGNDGPSIATLRWVTGCQGPGAVGENQYVGYFRTRLFHGSLT